MPSGATSAAPGFTPTSGGMDISDAGIKFSTALFRAMGAAPTSGRMTGDLLRQLLGQTGASLASDPGDVQASAPLPIMETSFDFAEWFAALTADAGTPSPTNGPPVSTAPIAVDPLLQSLPGAAEFSIPLETMAALLAGEYARLATEFTSWEAGVTSLDPLPVNDPSLETDPAPADGAAKADLAAQLLTDLSDAGKLTQVQISGAQVAPPTPFVPGAVSPTSRGVTARSLGQLVNGSKGDIRALDGQGALRGGGLLPLGQLPKETRVEVPRAVLGRFQAAAAAPAAIPNPSVLTAVELSAEGVSTEDRNATVLARIDRVEFVTRMAQALERAHLESPKVIELELNPPSLGKLRIQVVDLGGQLTARIDAETPHARSILLDHLPILDRNLTDHGIQMQKLHVNHQAAQVAQFASGGFGQPQQQGRQQPGSSAANTEERDSDEPRGPPLSIRDLFAWAPGMNRLI